MIGPETGIREECVVPVVKVTCRWAQSCRGAL